MINNHFYHRIIRKYVIAFGSLFNNITVVRYNKEGTTETDRMIVPISYAPKEKYLTKVRQDSDFNRTVQTILPRMAYEIIDFKYDASRKFMTTLKNTHTSSTGVVSSVYAPVPYDIDFKLYILVRNIEDGNQIVEQILPYFTPQYNLKLNLITSTNTTKDIPIVLNDVDQTIDYEGTFETTRNIIWTLSFTMKAYFFGPTNDNTSIIRKVIVSIFDDYAKLFEDKITLNLGDGFGTYIDGDYVYQGADKYNATAFGQILYYNNLANVLTVKNIQGVFQVETQIKGVDSTGTYNVVSFNYNNDREAVRITVTPDPLDAEPEDDYGYDTLIQEAPNIT